MTTQPHILTGPFSDEVDPEAARLREIRKERRELIKRVVLTFLVWCAVVIIFALIMGA